MTEVVLRDVEPADLPAFFEHQLDLTATRMAGLPPRDAAAFDLHWEHRILGDDTVFKQTIVFREQVAGYLLCFDLGGRRVVGYWLGARFWGQGIASAALSQFLVQVTERPLHAHVAKDNLGSIRVLEKCGFVRCGEGEIPGANASGVREEFLYTRTT